MHSEKKTPDQAARFLQILDSTAEYFTFQTFDDKGQDKTLASIVSAPFSIAAIQLTYLNESGAGVFVCVNHTERGKRTNDSVKRIRAVWCDWDSPDKKPPAWPIQPHMIVQTSPGKYHFYWLVNGLSKEDHAGVMARLIMMGGDKAAKDLARVLRVPGFDHCKGKRIPVELYHESGEAPFSREQILEAFPPIIKPRAPTIQAAPVSSSAEVPVVMGIVSQAATWTHENPESSRHSYVYWVGCEMQARGCSNQHFDLALDFCERLFRPTDSIGKPAPFNRANEMKALIDGYNKADTTPTKLPIDREPRIHDYKPNHESFSTKAFLAWLQSTRSVLADIHEWGEKTAHKPQPDLALHAALGLVSANLARRYKTDTGTPASLYLISLAQSGEGKEHGRTMISRGLQACYLDHRISGEPASAGGMFSSICRNPVQAYMIDEFGYFMKKGQDARTQKFGVLQEILKLFSGHAGCYVTDNYSKKGKTKEEAAEAYQEERVWNPEVILYGTSTPSTFYDALSSKDGASGFLNRLLVMESREPRQKLRRHFEGTEAFSAYKQWAAEVYRRHGGHESAQEEATLIRLTISEAAWAIVDDREDQIIAMYKKLDEIGHGEFMSRTLEKGIRVALCLELARDPHATEISSECMAWGIDYALHCDKQFLKRAGVMIADTDFERVMNKTLEKIRECGHGGMSLRDLYRQKPLYALPLKERQNVIATLEDADLIERFEAPKKLGNQGKPAVWVRA